MDEDVGLPLRGEPLNIFIWQREYGFYDVNRTKLKTQTKCTLTLSGLLIIEMLPIPLTSFVCLYVIRKRPKWLPGVIDRLYAEKDIKHESTPALFDEKKSMVTRRRCTISLSIMILLDFLIPFTILVSLYITRRRPIWFKDVVSRLYADLIVNNEKAESLLGETNGYREALEKKFIALQKSNNEFVLNIGDKNQRIIR